MVVAQVFLQQKLLTLKMVRPRPFHSTIHEMDRRMPCVNIRNLSCDAYRRCDSFRPDIVVFGSDPKFLPFRITKVSRSLFSLSKTLVRGTNVKVTTMATSDKLSLKLLIDENSQQVLFAEAGKDFVDFLFNLLCLPVGSIVGHLSTSKDKMHGCLGNLYESVERLGDAYFQHDSSRDDLLNPRIPSAVTQAPLLLPMGVSLKYFTCGCCDDYVTDNPAGANCPRCQRPMKREVQYVGRSPNPKAISSTGDGGFVKGVVTYMVMDDLRVMPMSTVSSVAFLNKYIKDSLEEKIVDLGMEEGLELLRVSLQSTAVLTEVFLGKTRIIKT